MRLFLLLLVFIGFISGFLNANSTTEFIVWFIVGTAGLLDVTTLGLSSEQVINNLKSVL